MGIKTILRAPLHYLSLVQHEDVVGVDDGGEAVGDDDGGPVSANTGQGRLDVAFCLRVQR